MISLEPGEKIVLEVRKHWFIFLLQTVFSALIAIAPLIIFAILQSGILPLQIDFSGKIIYLATFLYAVWLLAVWISFFVQWTDYYLDVWYITERRIFDVDQKGFFHREVAILRLERIQDITVLTRGILQTLLDFGTVRVQTAGENVDFIIPNASDPDSIKELISNLYAKRIAENRNQNQPGHDV